MENKPKPSTKKKKPPDAFSTPLQKRLDRIKANIEKKGGFRSEEEIQAHKIEMAKSASQTIQDSLEEARSYITQHYPPEKKSDSFLPTTMTRTSPFFPINRNQMKTIAFESVTFQTAWGQVNFEGRKLSVYDESILLVLLAMAKKYQSESFETTQYEICKILNVARSSNVYNAIWNSINRLSGTRVNIDIKENSKNIYQLTGTMLLLGAKSNKTEKLKIILNSYFLEMFGAKLITRINLDFRNSLKGDITKALYRFYESQKNNQYRCHITTLAKAINLNIPLRRLKERFQIALRELKNKEYLSKWGISKEDVVMIWKNKKA